jgi:DNA transposition AAA+ family ATPase
MRQTTKFITTKEYGRFAEFCYACKSEHYIGLCYGSAGVGKSMAAYHFADWHEILREFALKKRYIMDYTWPAADSRYFDTVVYTPPVNNTPVAIQAAIKQLALDFEILTTLPNSRYSKVPRRERTIERVALLIIDEADRLQPKCLEAVRDIYDQQQIAVVLIGMPGIEKRLIRFPQLYSRIGFAHHYKPLTKEETVLLIQKSLHMFDVTIDKEAFTDREAIAVFTRITQGNFRLIDRLLKQTIRVMEVNRLSCITKDVVEAARECLVIGNIH